MAEGKIGIEDIFNGWVSEAQAVIKNLEFDVDGIDLECENIIKALPTHMRAEAVIQAIKAQSADQAAHLHAQLLEWTRAKNLLLSVMDDEFESEAIDETEPGANVQTVVSRRTRLTVRDINIDELVDEVNTLLMQDTTPIEIRERFGPQAIRNPAFNSYHDVLLAAKPGPLVETFDLSRTMISFMTWMLTSGFKYVEIAKFCALSERVVCDFFRENYPDYDQVFSFEKRLATCKQYRAGNHEIAWTPGILWIPDAQVTVSIKSHGRKRNKKAAVGDVIL